MSADVKYYEVAIACNLFQNFVYKSEIKINVGQRILVQFGKQTKIAVVIKVFATKPDYINPKIKLKNITEVIDKKPIYSSVLLQMAKWMSSYYIAPLGEVLKTMLPVSSKSIKKTSFEISIKGKAEIKSNTSIGEILNCIYSRKDIITANTFNIKLKKFLVEHAEQQYKNLTHQYFLDLKLISKTTKSLIKTKDFNTSSQLKDITKIEIKEDSIILNSEQQRACTYINKQLAASAKSKQPILLHGVTGSGKTEVYIRTITHLQKLNPENSAQTLILVPEIALTPQMTMIFEQRFADNVVVVHSALSDNERWNRLKLLNNNKKQILIGPRSAVFAPFTNLGLIIVDEEHDSSYKQSTGFTYNGRDCAILRAKLENATIILGSATPSLESYYNAKMNKYYLLNMPNRANSQPLPQVDFIKPVAKSDSLKLTRNQLFSDFPQIFQSNSKIDQRIITALTDTIHKNEQAIMIANRRGYAYTLKKLSDQEVISCNSCSISLTLHLKDKSLKCHYCDFHISLTALLKKYPEECFIAYGFGSEKAEAYLKQLIPESKLARLDSDVIRKKGILDDTLKTFREHKTNILVGTQILAKGHNFPKVTLMAILEIDQLLDMPDFRAGERLFQLIVQASGRAGRADLTGRVLIQTTNSEHRIVKTAIKHDYITFADKELRFRKAHNFPPFTKMVLVEITSTDKMKLTKLRQSINKWKANYLKNNVELSIVGPITPAIDYIRKKHRSHIIISAKESSITKQCVKDILNLLKPMLSYQMKTKVDVDPLSIM